MKDLSSNKSQRIANNSLKFAITAAGMTGVWIGAYHVKNKVSEATGNELFGWGAGIGTLLLGSVIVTSINNRVDKVFDMKILPSTLPVSIDIPDNFGLVLDGGEEGDF